MITNNILHIDIEWRIFVFFSALLYSTQLNSTLLPSSMFYFCFSSIFFIPLSVYLSVSIYLCIYLSIFLLLFLSDFQPNTPSPFFAAPFHRMQFPTWWLLLLFPSFLSSYLFISLIFFTNSVSISDFLFLYFYFIFYSDRDLNTSLRQRYWVSTPRDGPAKYCCYSILQPQPGYKS